MQRFGGTPDFCHELVTIEGDPQIVTPEFLVSIDQIMHMSQPLMRCDLGEFLISCQRGITTPKDPDADRMIAALFTWRDPQRREVFIDPDQDSSQGTLCYDNTVYDELFVAKVREMESRGAIVHTSMLRLQQWRPARREESRRHKCVVLWSLL